MPGRAQRGATEPPQEKDVAASYQQRKADREGEREKLREAQQLLSAPGAFPLLSVFSWGVLSVGSV